MKFLLSLLLCLPFASFADNTPYSFEKNCASNSSAERIKEELKRIDAHVPNIPPDEEKYFRKEYETIMNSSSLSRAIRGERYAELQQRKLFHAWRLREQFAPLQLKLNDLFNEKQTSRGKYKSVPANQLAQAIDLFSDVIRFKEETVEYIDRDPENRAANFAAIGLGVSFIGSSLEEFMQCKLAQIVK